jgi:mannitol/fructose-specific phosphotransferase system IIA component (Ntr-type)
MTTEDIHTCHADCQRPACVAVREAVAAEREACAQVCDQLAAKDSLSNYYKHAALLIRERGAP